MRAPGAGILPVPDDSARAHVHHRDAPDPARLIVEGREHVVAVSDITARSPIDPAGPICTVPISSSLTVSTNASAAGMPRMLTTSVRSFGVSMTDSG